MSFKLSKSKLKSFAQCPKRLWLQVNDPFRAEKDEMAELILLRGTAFGEAIRNCFADGVLINEHSPDAAVRKTTELWAEFAAGRARVPVFEAAFAVNEVVVYADVLEPDAGNSWCLIEVKSSVLKEADTPRVDYVSDAATQTWVLEKCGLSISRVELAQPTKQFVLPQDRRVDGILSRVDVTQAVRKLLPQIEVTVEDALELLTQTSEPTMEIGAHCKEPNKCSFIRYCSGAYLKAGEQLSIPVWELSAEPTTKIVADLMKEGYRDLANVPEERLDKAMHRTIRRIALGADPYCDPRLLNHLRSQPFPRYFLDYETNNPTLPLWRGTRPGERVTFQFSLHKWVSEQGPIEHVEFIGEDFNDPRPALAEKLALVMQERAPVYAWNGNSTEGPITLELAQYCSLHSETLEWVACSCKDNDPVKYFRKWFYHPTMRGNWGLKAVARAVLDNSPYESLAVANGVDAMREYEQFLLLQEGKKREVLKQNLLDYCNTDTKVMIDIWKKLTN